MMNRMQQQRMAMAAQHSAQGQQRQPSVAVTQEEKPQPGRNAHRGSKSDIPPAAPTSEKPPFSLGLGAASPHGTPHYATGTIEQQINLTIPPKKKRKNEQAAESAKPTPPRQQTTPASGETKPPAAAAAAAAAPAPQQMAPPPVKNLPFKCRIPQCDTPGFESRALADTHAKEAHAWNGDELEWCLISLRDVLNLDSRGQPVEKVEPGSGAPLAGKPDAKATPAPKKEDSQPATVSSTKTSTPSTAAKATDTPAAQGRGEGSQATPASKPASARPASIISKASAQQKSRASGLTPEEAWAASNISRATLFTLFSNLDGFPASRSDSFEAFGGVKCPIPEWKSEEEPGSTAPKSGAEMERSKSKGKDGSPASLVHIELDDWDPFPRVEGGPDPYEGMDYEVVIPDYMKDEAKMGGEPVTDEAAQRKLQDALWEPTRVNAVLKREREAEAAKEQWDDFDWDTIDWEGDGLAFKSAAGEAKAKGRAEDEGVSPPKKVKTSP